MCFLFAKNICQNYVELLKKATLKIIFLRICSVVHTFLRLAIIEKNEKNKSSQKKYPREKQVYSRERGEEIKSKLQVYLKLNKLDSS